MPLARVCERAVVPYGDSMTVAWFQHRPARVPAWVVDAGWAVAVGIAVTIAIRAGTEPGARPRDLLAYALGWTIGALLLARRWPLAVLVASSATLQIYYLLDYPGISAAVPLAVALYTAGAAGHLRLGLLIAGVFVAGAIAFLVLVSQEPVLSVLGVLVDEATLWLAILLFGDAVHAVASWPTSNGCWRPSGHGRRGCCATCCPPPSPSGSSSGRRSSPTPPPR